MKGTPPLTPKRRTHTVTPEPEVGPRRLESFVHPPVTCKRGPLEVVGDHLPIDPSVRIPLGEETTTTPSQFDNGIK